MVRSTSNRAEFVLEIPKQFHPRISKDFLVKVFLSNDFFEIYMAQPRSQSSSAISDLTSPVKLVGKIRRGRLALLRLVPSPLWSLG